MSHCTQKGNQTKTFLKKLKKLNVPAVSREQNLSLIKKDYSPNCDIDIFEQNH